MASEVRAVCTTSSPSPGNAEAGSSPTVTVGGITYRLPFADLLPALSDDDLGALRGDIRERGIVVPIVIDEHHNVIDGANRLRIAAARGRPSGSPPSRHLRLDGALSIFVAYMLDTAIRPQPWLAVGAALTAIGTLMGRRYRTTSNLRSNLYVIGMAASGGGKDHARNAIKEAFLAAGLAEHLGGNRLASGAGLLAALRRQPASLFQIDEFGQFVASIIDKRRSPKHLAEIWDLLTELSTSAGSTFFGAEYADQKLKPREDIIQPCCAIHATTVPETFWPALRSGSLQDGSLARSS